MSDITAPRQSSPLIAYLYGLADKQDESRAVLAALRRGLGERPGTAVGMYRYIARHVPRESSSWVHDAHYLIAGLFALHPLPWPEPRGTYASNLGGSFAELKRRVEARRKKDSDTSVEQRFTALLDAHRDDVGEHLRHAVSLLKAHNVPVDWAQLLTNVTYWDTEDRGVQRRWARTFWSTPLADDPPAGGDTPTSPDNVLTAL